MLKGRSREVSFTLVKSFQICTYSPCSFLLSGEYYGFEVTHEVKNLLYVFAAGYLAIILWKG